MASCVQKLLASNENVNVKLPNVLLICMHKFLHCTYPSAAAFWLLWCTACAAPKPNPFWGKYQIASVPQRMHVRMDITLHWDLAFSLRLLSIECARIAVQNNSKQTTQNRLQGSAAQMHCVWFMSCMTQNCHCRKQGHLSRFTCLRAKQTRECSRAWLDKAMLPKFSCLHAPIIGTNGTSSSAAPAVFLLC
jgi:hypothetical protein